MRFTILEEIKSTLPKSLFYNDYYPQIKSNQIKRGKTQGIPEKTSHSRVENQQT